MGNKPYASHIKCTISGKIQLKTQCRSQIKPITGKIGHIKKSGYNTTLKREVDERNEGVQTVVYIYI